MLQLREVRVLPFVSGPGVFGYKQDISNVAAGSVYANHK
jgi:hypothetical protein